MQNKIIFILCFWCAIIIQAQTHNYWLIDQKTNQKTIRKDSASAVQFLDSLAQKAYLATRLTSIQTHTNFTEIKYDKGPNFNEAEVSFSDQLQAELNAPKKAFIKNLDSLRNVIHQHYRKKGYAFNRVKTEVIRIQGKNIDLKMSVDIGEQRHIDAFVLRGYERAPQSFIKNLEKKYLKKNYDDNTLLAIQRDLQNHNFVSLDKPPQTLFTKDSTQVFLFLNKRKLNNFDGIVGFGNDKTEKFTFNGSINVALKNMFNAFESIQLYWQRNPDRGQTFELETDVPYAIGSKIGLNLAVNIYRQDSTFATVKFRPSVYYHLSQNQKLGLRGRFETSAVLDSLYTQAQDFTKKGIGIWYAYQKSSPISLFSHTSLLRGEVDFVSVNYDKTNETVKQLNYFVSGEHNINLQGNHYLNIKAESALLSSKLNPSVNELYRFGGWNSLRGFNELSLIGNFYAYGGLEYRYLINEQAFFDLFGQLSTLTNKSLNVSPSLYSFGLGFNFFLPVGLMSLQISSGNQFGTLIQFSDTKIHWGITSRF